MSDAPYFGLYSIICTIGKSTFTLLNKADHFQYQHCSLLESGPKTNSVAMMTDLRKAGMNIVRMNFSHGSYEVSFRKWDLHLIATVLTRFYIVPWIGCKKHSSELQRYVSLLVLFIEKSGILTLRPRLSGKAGCYCTRHGMTYLTIYINPFC